MQLSSYSHKLLLEQIRFRRDLTKMVTVAVLSAALLVVLSWPLGLPAVAVAFIITEVTVLGVSGAAVIYKRDKRRRQALHTEFMRGGESFR